MANSLLSLVLDLFPGLSTRWPGRARVLRTDDPASPALRWVRRSPTLTITEDAVDAVASQPAARDRVRRPTPPVPPRSALPRGRYWALAASVLALTPPFSLAGLVSALLATLRPARTVLAVAGTVGLVAALLALRGSVGRLDGLLLVAPAIAQGFVGLVLLWLARGEPEAAAVAHDPAPPTLAVLAGLLTMDLAGLSLRLSSPLPLTELHVWARYEAGAAAVLFGMAAVALARRPRRRGFATVATLLAVLCLGVGSSAFRDGFGDDPLRVGEGGAPVTVLQPRLLETRWLNSRVTDLRLAPSGRRLATATLPAPDGGRSTGFRRGFLVDRSEGPSRFVEALDLAFLSDDRLVLLVEGPREGLQLRMLGPDLRRTIGPEVGLPSLLSPRLEVEFHRGRWTVTGVREEGTSGVRLSGKLGERGYRETVWTARSVQATRLAQVVVGPEPRALAITTRDRVPGLPTAARLLHPSSGSLGVSELALVEVSAGDPVAADPPAGGPAAAATAVGQRLARTSTRVHCRAAARYSGFLCVAIDAEPTSRLWRVDPVSGQLDLVATLTGAYHGPIVVSGGRVLLDGGAWPPALVNLSTGRVWKLDLGIDVPDRRAFEQAEPAARGLTAPAFAATDATGDVVATLTGDFLAVSFLEGEGSRIRTFRLPRH